MSLIPQLHSVHAQISNICTYELKFDRGVFYACHDVASAKAGRFPKSSVRLV